MPVRELSAVLQKRSKSELNEDERRTPSDIAALQHWLAKQPHLASVKPSTQWLLAFLRGSKFSLERTKEKLDMYYTMRSLVPELFGDRDPMNTKVQEILKLGTFLPLKSCVGADGPRPCLVRLGVYDPAHNTLLDLMKVCFMVTEILMLEDDNFVVAGEEIILDLKGVTLSVIGQFTPTLARKVTACLERGLPVRQRGNHMMHTPPGFEAVFAMFKGLLSDKLKKRVRVHNLDYEALYSHIPKKVLPEEYGGEDGNLQELTDHWKAKVESYRDWFLKEEQQKSDENKRPGNPNTSEKLFGVQGSFRQLDFD